MSDLERRVAGRFKVIWSVFRAHSSAEDEFIWPTLQSKTQGKVKGSPKYAPDHHGSQGPLKDHATTRTDDKSQEGRTQELSSKLQPSIGAATKEMIEQGEYEEDHADEERMFSMMDDLLTKFRQELLKQRQEIVSAVSNPRDDSSKRDSVDDTVKAINELNKLCKTLSKHLLAHLEKEEKQCMPLVVKHLSKSEIHDLVGKIMGKRSSDIIAQIMTMAVQNLNEKDREEMVKYMKQAMAGTFFDRWLTMSGWMSDRNGSNDKSPCAKEDGKKRAPPKTTPTTSSDGASHSKRTKSENTDLMEEASCPLSAGTSVAATSASAESTTWVPQSGNPAGEVTSQAELEKLIRAIATNPNLTALQKNTTIQGLRDSVWKSNQRVKQNSELQPFAVVSNQIQNYQCAVNTSR